jgi:argininosuccinate lyase
MVEGVTTDEARAQQEAHSDYAQNVGGRLASPKSATYRRAVWAVEDRANRFIARHMLASDIAYALSANELDLVPDATTRPLLQALLDLLADPPLGGAPLGDIVVARETWVTERVGREVGSWVHLGRNRGESIRSYMPRLFFRDMLHKQRGAVLRLINALVDVAEPNLDALAPQFHHLQHACYTTLGEYLLSWAASLRPGIDRLDQAALRIDLAPLATGGHPRIIALSRAVARRLGFSRVALLRREGLWAEDQFTDPFIPMVQLAMDLGRLAEDLRLWMTIEFDYFEPADEHASSSSAAPQKKNPFALQTVIGGAAMGIGRLMGQFAANLSPSDESDGLFHIGSFYQYADDLIAWTDLMADIVAKGRFKTDELRRKASWGFSGTNEAVDVLTCDYGVPMRIAHHALGTIVRHLHEGLPVPNIGDLIERDLGRRLSVDHDQIVAMVTGESLPETAVNTREINEAFHKLKQENAAMLAQHADISPVEAAYGRLQAEAKAWLTRNQA